MPIAPVPSALVPMAIGCLVQPSTLGPVCIVVIESIVTLDLFYWGGLLLKFSCFKLFSEDFPKTKLDLTGMILTSHLILCWKWVGMHIEHVHQDSSQLGKMFHYFFLFFFMQLKKSFN